MDTCYYTFVKMHRTYKTKEEPKVNYGLRVIMICQGMFISCEKCHTVDIISEEDQTRVGMGRGTLYFPLSFAVNLRLLF